MRGYRWALAAAALGLVGIVTVSARLPLFRINQDAFDTYQARAIAGQPIRQTIESHYPGLTAVVLQLAEPYPPDDQPVAIQLEELAPAPRERLSVTQPLAALRRGGQLRVTFDPLDDSAGRNYLLVVWTSGPQPVVLRAHSLNIYPSGELAGGGDLMFEARYNGLLLPTLQALPPRLALHKPGPFGWPWLYAVLGVAYGLALCGTLVVLARVATCENQRPPVPGQAAG